MASNKNIVICSDGTGNSAIKGRGTNVFKIFEAVDIYGHWDDPSLRPQVAIYDDGVGTESFKPLRILGGAFGWGLGRNIRQLYTELARVYEPGDSIYLFGFSRGAFTVRSLAGFIGACGIIDRAKLGNGTIQDLVNEAYRTYRTTYRGGGNGSKARQQADNFRNEHSVVHEQHAPGGRLKIRFIGVWDTVDAVGLPFDELSVVLNGIFRFKFPDYVLGDHIQRACHALSIDDERRTFHPLMWDESVERHEEGKERIEQVWFPGVHSNVGGGYPKQGMSLVSLFWMMNKAEEAELRFVDCDRHMVLDHQNPFDKLYDSRSGFGVYYRYLPRDISRMCDRHGTLPKIHLSALERIILGTGGYAPGNIPAGCSIVTTGTPLRGLQTAAKEISQALKGRTSLLESVQPWVLLRHYAHLVFLAVSVLALVFLLLDSHRQAGREGITFSLNGFLKLAVCMMQNPNLYGALLAIIAVFYLVGLLARQRMDRIFTRFWAELHTKLRDHLYP